MQSHICAGVSSAASGEFPERQACFVVMSLFETKQWWGANLAAGEQFVGGALAVGNVDNETSGQCEYRC